MSAIKLEPREALNSAYWKVKPDRENIKAFKAGLAKLIELINESKSEEFHKNLISAFLKETYYDDRYFINTKENSDLVIHNLKGVESTVGVIFETKKPTKTNNAEMPKVDNLNAKAFQQLVLYFLRERVTHKNLDVRYLIVTNVYEWFIFDAAFFEQLFFNDKALVKKFTDFEEKRLSGSKTGVFYKDIAKPAIANVIDRIKFTHFDIRDYKDLVKSDDKQGDRELIDLYKLLSPEHLLKLRFANDSNTLNKPFYNELLYIIGLVEKKDGGKKLIGRRADVDRQDGSLIENAIGRLDSLDKISQLKKTEEFGDTYEEKLFNVALRLSINWINRILFLKLLEAQLIKYHQGNLDSAREFAFLNLEKVRNYADLNSLFFDVLAREQDKREQDVKAVFANVPYLNSSLFEPTETEQQTIDISNLKARSLPIFGATVLTDGNDKKRSGDLNALEYLFEFLHAYKFNKDEFEDGQEDSEKLINAAVLGLIFEKINGYKDGSFYTPSFITMYMCRETIRRAVVQKFNEVKGWSCENIQDLCDDLGRYIKGTDRVVRRNEANGIVNSLKICDPAVGSGHFLVSALNEMIAIKQYLGILQDRNGESLSKYEIEVVNDKLKVTLDNKLFAYNPKNKESQRVQEALFHEKQTIIEGCLFGVDINPNSVKICQLRLWIELLKNAYYRVDLPQASLAIDPPQPPLIRGEKSRLKSGENINASFPPFTRGDRGDLETLPNIDINIKCGNSLISRFGLDVDVKQVLQKQKFSIEQYRNAVQTYRSAESKAQKREMEGLIAKIKAGFSSSLLTGDPKKVKLRQLQAELYSVENQMLLLEETKAEVKAREKRVNKLNNEIDKLSAEIEDIESGRLYENALEWRFEFPEVLNDDGDFVGFDVVIGNPPYGTILEEKQKTYILNNYSYTDYQLDVYGIFFELTEKILKSQSIFSFIIPNTWLLNLKTPNIRKLLFSLFIINKIRIYEEKIFELAIVDALIIIGQKNSYDFIKNDFEVEIIKKENQNIINSFNQELLLKNYKQTVNIHESIFATSIKQKFDTLFKLLDISNITQGTKPFQKGKGKPSQTQQTLDEKPFVQEYKKDNSFRPLLRGSLINKYSILWDNNYYISFGDWLAEPRYSANYDAKKKILVRQTGNSLIATLDKNQFIARDNLYVITSNNIEYTEEFILGLLNSYLLNWYYQNIINNEVGEVLAQVKKGHLSLLPIPKLNPLLFAEVENITNQILTAKKGDRHADTSELEKKCDRLVYKLYQLTYEEVKIIDPDFALTEQEYTAIKTG